MEKLVMKCSKGQRIFDVKGDSNLKVEIECNNRDCKRKFKCKNKEEICVGNIASHTKREYISYRCPVCGRRLFDATKGSCGEIEIKCTYHRSIVNISIGDVGSTTFVA